MPLSKAVARQAVSQAFRAAGDYRRTVTFIKKKAAGWDLVGARPLAEDGSAATDTSTEVDVLHYATTTKQDGSVSVSLASMERPEIGTKFDLDGHTYRVVAPIQASGGVFYEFSAEREN